MKHSHILKNMRVFFRVGFGYSNILENVGML
jgi:hypothetical protein